MRFLFSAREKVKEGCSQELAEKKYKKVKNEKGIRTIGPLCLQVRMASAIWMSRQAVKFRRGDSGDSSVIDVMNLVS